MRRLLLALLICLLPLQSFAGMVMNTKMAGMESSMSMVMTTNDATQALCHKDFQPMQAASQDCCDLQGICQVMCHLSVGLPLSNVLTLADLSNHLPHQAIAQFQSADLSAGFKPPLL